MDANFECNEESINLQAIDNFHVALVAVKLLANGDWPIPLAWIWRVLLKSWNVRRIMLKAVDEADLLNFVYEAKSELSFLFLCWLNFFFFQCGVARRHVDFFVIYEFNAQKFFFYVDSDRMTK